MMAYMVTSRKTSRAMCSSGSMALRMEFITTCRPESSQTIARDSKVITKGCALTGSYSGLQRRGVRAAAP